MKRFCVKLVASFFVEREEVVHADSFKQNNYADTITFVDDQGKSVAMFRSEDVKSINLVAESWQE